MRRHSKDEFASTQTAWYLPRMRLALRVISFLLLMILGALPLEARVLRVEIASRTDVLNGKEIGRAHV